MSQAQLGFSGSIEGASLADLIQMECLSGNRRAIRVTSEDQVGYLFLADGRVVHSFTADLSGEEAAIEILGWAFGAFEPCNANWPKAPQIDAPFQSLLLRAAQERDERARDDNVVPLMRQRGAAPPASQRTPRSTTYVELDERDFEMNLADEIVLPQGVLGVVRLTADGEVSERVGSAHNSFADALSLTIQLANRLGETLGLEGLISVESVGHEHKTYLVTRPDGGSAGVVATAQTETRHLVDALDGGRS